MQRATPATRTGEGLLQTWMESKYPVSSPSPSREPHPRLRQGRICCRPGWKVSTLSPHLPLLQRATPTTQTGEGLLQTWMESKYPVSSPFPSSREPHPRLRQGRVCCRPGWKVSTLSPHPPLLQRATPTTWTGEVLPQTWMESKYRVSSPSPSSREPHPRLGQGRVCCRPGQKVSTLSPHPPPPPESHTRDSDRGGSAADLDGK